MSPDKSNIQKELKQSFGRYLKYPLAIYGAYILLGLFLHALYPITIIPPFVQTYIGVFIVLIGLVPMQWAIKTIYNEGYTWQPLHYNYVFTASGPYKYSRNPIYIGYCCIFVGLFIFLNNILGVIMLIPLIYSLNKLVLSPAEKVMEQEYGEPYKDYRKKVARWL